MDEPRLDVGIKVGDLIEYLPFAVLVATPPGRVIAANRSALGLFLYSSREMIGLQIEDLIPERYRREHVEQRTGFQRNAHRRPMGIGMDLIGLKKDGTEFPAEVALSSAELSDQKFIICFVSDISIRKRVEEENKHLIVQLQRALDDVRKLSGLLPICSSCKRIRDDAGRWTAIENYIVDNSDTEFSHGICPDCAERLYPQYFSKES